jgi:hypothetical protein
MPHSVCVHNVRACVELLTVALSEWLAAVCGMVCACWQRTSMQQTLQECTV